MHRPHAAHKSERPHFYPARSPGPTRTATAVRQRLLPQQLWTEASQPRARTAAACFDHGVAAALPPHPPSGRRPRRQDGRRAGCGRLRQNAVTGRALRGGACSTAAAHSDALHRCALRWVAVAPHQARFRKACGVARTTSAHPRVAAARQGWATSSASSSRVRGRTSPRGGPRSRSRSCDRSA